MQTQIDMMILERVSDGFFSLTLDSTSSDKYIEDQYRGRGFLVRQVGNIITIDWSRPDIDGLQKPQTKIYSNFTAQQLYQVMTAGLDLRSVTNVIVYENIIRGIDTVSTYGMQKNTVYNMYQKAIDRAIGEGYIVVITDDGIIKSSLDTPTPISNKIEVEGFTPNTTNINPVDLISNTPNNEIELGNDFKLFVDNPLKSENW